VAGGGRVAWLAPDYPQARSAWRALREVVAGATAWALAEGEQRVTHESGGWLEVRSAEAVDGVRGLGLDGAVVDEAAYIDRLDYAVGSVLRPALADRAGWLLVLSTPRVGSHFNNLAGTVEAGTLAGWRGWRWRTRDNATIPAEEIDALAASFPPGSTDAAQELDAELLTEHGELFDRIHFRPYLRADATGMEVDDGAWLPFVETVAYCDLAVSLRTSADYTVVLVAGLTAADGHGTRRAGVLDLLRRRLEGPDQVALLRDVVARWQPTAVKIEAVSYQAVLAQHLRRELPSQRVVELRPDRDKRSRAVPAAAAMARGEVRFPLTAPWRADLVAECIAFPRGRHDDQVDVLSYLGADLVTRPRPTRRGGFEVWAGGVAVGFRPRMAHPQQWPSPHAIPNVPPPDPPRRPAA
jgi:predicted phage terminase large subunit-like protein